MTSPDDIKAKTFENAASNNFKATLESAGNDIDLVRKALITNLPPDWLPENYDLIEALNLQQLQLILCWLSLTWHAGYDAGYAERENGQPHLRARIAAHLKQQQGTPKEGT